MYPITIHHVALRGKRIQEDAVFDFDFFNRYLQVHDRHDQPPPR